MLVDVGGVCFFTIFIHYIDVNIGYASYVY